MASSLTSRTSWTSPRTMFQILFVNFGLFFQSTTVVLTQLFSVFIYPFSFKLYRGFISYTMRMWSQNLVALVQWFAPARVIMTFDPNCGPMEDIVQKSNDVVSLKFPKRMIVTANHQVKNENKIQVLLVIQSNLMYFYIAPDICRLDLYLVYCLFS
jgi:hypothetical protein